MLGNDDQIKEAIGFCSFCGTESGATKKSSDADLRNGN